MDKYADAQSHETTGTPRDFIIRNAHPLLVVRDFVKDRFALEICFEAEEAPLIPEEET